MKLIINKILFRLQYLWHKKTLPFLEVPGMMGYQERINLFKTCQYELAGNGAAIEFGAFLGASTSAIQAGLRLNLNTKNTIFHIVDYFRSGLDTEFSQLTRSITKDSHQEFLLYEKDGWLCFDKAFFNNIDAKDPNIYVHQVLLDNFEWNSQPVEFLHLDLPKDWRLAYPIARIIFPDLIIGAKILFQDFGYQWSAEVIAMVGHMSELGLIKPYRITDTTLSVEVIKKITIEEVNKINALYLDYSEVIRCIDIARKFVKPLCSQTDNTLKLAKAQYHYINNNQKQAFLMISETLKDTLFSVETRSRMQDLFEKNFSPDKSYEKSETKGAI